MFKTLILLCIFIGGRTSALAETYKRIDYTCPFANRDGSYCLRTQQFKHNLQDYPQELNVRPDVDPTNATDAENLSTIMCCYERECLEECNIYDKVIDNIYSKNICRYVIKLTNKHPEFFKVKDKESFQLLYSNIYIPSEIEKWKIRLAHFADFEKKTQLH